jgi:hypothetical protein
MKQCMRSILGLSSMTIVPGMHQVLPRYISSPGLQHEAVYSARYISSLLHGYTTIRGMHQLSGHVYCRREPLNFCKNYEKQIPHSKWGTNGSTRSIHGHISKKIS